MPASRRQRASARDVSAT